MCSTNPGFHSVQWLTLCPSREHFLLPPTECAFSDGLGEWKEQQREAPGMEAVQSTLPVPGVFQDSDYVVAVRNFLSEDPELLSFHKGDIIHLQRLEPPRVGQLHGWVKVHKRGAAEQMASLVHADASSFRRLQRRLCGPQETGVPGRAAAERP